MHTSIKAFLVLLDLRATAGNPVKTLFLTTAEVEVTIKVSEISKVACRMDTDSIHLHGSAGIQNSVLSLESSRRLAIRVCRVCSTKGRLITFKT